jgi:DNA-binding GntR family transcriptional regulator
MTAPHVRWQAAADDDETAPGPAGAAGGSDVVSAGAQPVRAADVSDEAGPAVSVLADRLAAALVHHEPGWRLPRHSALARRYNVSPAEIDAAVSELASRHLVRRLADGQVYRASPAEYVIGLEGVPGLLSHVDAMGGDFACRNRQVAWRVPPEDISWALRLADGQQVCVVRFLWTAGGEPAALCTTYIPGDIASRPDGGTTDGLPQVLNLLKLTGGAEATGGPGAAIAPPLEGSPTALHIEMHAPPPSIARSLRLTAGQPAMMVTVRFDDLDAGRPVALTVAVLRPDMFRVVVESPHPPLPDGHEGSLSGSWTHAIEEWGG